MLSAYEKVCGKWKKKAMLCNYRGNVYTPESYLHDLRNINVLHALAYKQKLTDSKEGSQSQGIPAKESTCTCNS